MQTASENFWKRWGNRLRPNLPRRLRRGQPINGRLCSRTWAP